MTTRFALLFDLDGTLVDTDAHHFHAYQQLLADFGRSVTLDTYRSRIMGAPNDAIMRELFPDLPVMRHRELAARKEALFRAALTRVEPKAGALDLFDWAHRHDVPTAVVTNAPRANAELMLRGLDLNDRIDVLVIGEELPRGKPDPLPYLTALRRLGGRADRAMAFEDSISGICSASTAGIHTFGMRSGLPDEALRAAGAAHVIDDFTAASVWQRLDATCGGAEQTDQTESTEPTEPRP